MIKQNAVSCWRRRFCLASRSAGCGLFRFLSVNICCEIRTNLNKKIYAKIEAWRNRRIEGEHPYLYLDGIVMKRSWAGEVRNVSLLVASAVNGRLSRDPGPLRGCQGRQIRLVGVSAPSGQPRPQGRAAGYFRRLQRPCRERRGFPAGGTLPTLHGAFLSQRLQPRPFNQGSRGEPHAQGRSCQESREAADKKAQAIVDDLRAEDGASLEPCPLTPIYQNKSQPRRPPCASSFVMSPSR